ncbi:MAG: protein kinase [Planctomycetes bacterium]|nr:protein kinase [Planctomycetota bacterium]
MDEGLGETIKRQPAPLPQDVSTPPPPDAETPRPGSPLPRPPRSPEDTDRLLFGDLAVLYGFITREQLQEGMRLQTEQRALGVSVPLGQLLVQKGFLSPQRLSHVLGTQGKKCFRCVGCNSEFNVIGADERPPAPCPQCGRPLAAAVGSAPGAAHDTLVVDPKSGDFLKFHLPEQLDVTMKRAAPAPPPPTSPPDDERDEAADTAMTIKRAPSSSISPPATPTPPPTRATMTPPTRSSATPPSGPRVGTSLASSPSKAGGVSGPGASKTRSPVLKVGEKFGKFRLDKELGRGGMGIVFKAFQEDMQREVALKVLKSTDLTTEDIERFKKEASTCGQLNHPGIIRVFEVGVEQGIHYLTMEFIKGVTLDRWIAENRAASSGGPLRSRMMSLLTGAPAAGTPPSSKVGKPGEALPSDVPAPGSPALSIACKRSDPVTQNVLKYLIESSRALHHAHEKGIIHRDIKPQNIMIDIEGHAHVADFGLAKELKNEQGFTLSGTVLGTPYYMAPEQARGAIKELEQRSDVYSLGATLFHVLTGRPPHEGATVYEILQGVNRDDAPRLTTLIPGCDRDLDIIMQKVLEKPKDRRYSTAGEFADDLERYLKGDAISARPPSFGYRLQRTIQKSRKLQIGLAASFISIVAGLWYWFGLDEYRRQQAEEAVLKVARGKADSILEQLSGATDLDQKMSVIQRAIEAAPKYAMPYVRRGTIHFAKGNYAKAKDDFDKAKTLNESNALAWFWMGRVTESMNVGGKGAADAKPYYDRAVELYGEDPLGNLALGRLALSNKDVIHAVEYVQKVLALEPRNLEALITKGEAEFLGEKQLEAKSTFQQVLAIDDDYVPAYTGLATLYHTNNDLKGADDNLKRALDANKDCVPALYLRGKITFDQWEAKKRNDPGLYRKIKRDWGHLLELDADPSLKEAIVEQIPELKSFVKSPAGTTPTTSSVAGTTPTTSTTEPTTSPTGPAPVVKDPTPPPPVPPPTPPTAGTDPATASGSEDSDDVARLLAAHDFDAAKAVCEVLVTADETDGWPQWILWRLALRAARGEMDIRKRKDLLIQANKHETKWAGELRFDPMEPGIPNPFAADDPAWKGVPLVLTAEELADLAPKDKGK